LAEPTVRATGVRLEELRSARNSLTRRDFLKISGAGLAGMGLLGTAGCGVFSGDSGGGNGGGGGGGPLKINLGADIPDLASTTSTDEVSFNVLNNINEGLYRLDADEEPQPAMAESVEQSDDGLTYTFTLREGVQWSNGDPVTSEDFRYAWLRALNPDTAGQFAFILSDFIEGASDFAAGEGSAEDVGISAPDDQTLEVTLANPTPFFLGLTAFPTYFPLNQSFVEEQGDSFGRSADAILYNGPYTLSEFDSANGATFEKRGDYWDADNVAVETVDARIVKDEQTALNLYQSGELDRTGLTSEQVEQFRDSDEFSTELELTSWWFDMNLEDDVLSNKSIREAIQRAVDRQQLAQQVLNNGSVASEGLVPRETAGPDGETFREAYGSVVPEFAPEEAMRLYEQGVEELGQQPTLNILTGDTSVARDLATFLQGQLQENLGAEVEIDQQPFDARLERMEASDYQMVVSGWGADFNDPINFMNLYTSENSFNNSGFSNEEYDQLIEQAGSEADEQRRMELMADAESLLVQDEAAIAPLYYDGVAVLMKPRLQNFVTHPYGATYDFKYASLDG
jgi:oligopeptide transport system substrate-binding protein